MILQELVHYYDRAGNLAPEGWEWKRIPYVIEIRADGSFIQLTSLRNGPRNTDVKPSLVPKSENRSGTRAYEKPNLLWDHYGFVLGHAKSNKSKDLLAAQQQHQHFRLRIEQLIDADIEDEGLLAISRFFEQGSTVAVLRDPLWPECAKTAGCNFTFRLSGDNELIVQRPAIRAVVDAAAGTAAVDQPLGVCLVTGREASIQLLQPPIGGVCSKPTPLAAVNDLMSPAFSSFSKSQGLNFPIGETAAFKYATALNRLLEPESRQKFRLGDTVVVFWAQRSEDIEMEDGFAALFGDTDDPNARTAQVKALYESIFSGRWHDADQGRSFFVLGLAPNSGRMVVRFWHAAPLKDIAQRIRTWFDDLALVRGQHDTEFPNLFRLLTAVAVQGKADNIPPRLGGDILRSILDGAPYPVLWLNAAVQRCRAERQVNHLRATGIKACLNRALRSPFNQEEVIKPMLDTHNPSVAYRLGRLFATLEKIQEEAHHTRLSTTIRERYYGAASSTPAAVFTTLLRLKNHHLAKLEHRGRATYFEKLLGEIVSAIDDIPGHMVLQDQGRFALGYYHQRQDFFTGRDNAASNGDTQNTKED